MKEFEKAIHNIEKNISYYCFKVARETNENVNDIRQELLLRLWIANQKYDDKKSKMNTYLIVVLKQHVLKMIKDGKNEKKKFIKGMLYLHKKYRKNPDTDKIRELLDIIPDKKVKFVEQIEANSLFDIVENKLNEDAKAIFRLMRSNGYNLDDLSEMMRMSKQNICNIIRREIRPRIKRIFDV